MRSDLPLQPTLWDIDQHVRLTHMQVLVKIIVYGIMNTLGMFSMVFVLQHYET